MARLRSEQTGQWTSYSEDYQGNRYYTNHRTGITSDCTDGGPGYHKDKTFMVTRVNRTNTPTVSGTRTGRYAFQKCSLERYVPWTGSGPGSRPSSVPSNGVLATRIAATANPGAPIVDLPLFVYELRDLPKLLKQAGDLFHNSDGTRRWGRGRDIGSIHLMLQFGIFPILNDLVSLATFSSAVTRRVEQLERIGRGQPLKTQLGTWTSSSTGTDTVLGTVTNAFVLEGASHGVTTSKLWGYAYWRSLPEFKRGPKDLQYAAKMSALGLQAHVSTVWNALPWTWFIDWFSSFGDFLSIHRANEWGYALNGVYLCEHRETISTIKNPRFRQIKTSHPNDKSDISISNIGGSIRYETKSRTPVYPTPIAASLPFLTADQLAIVGSLATSSSRRRR